MSNKTKDKLKINGLFYVVLAIWVLAFSTYGLIYLSPSPSPDPQVCALQDVSCPETPEQRCSAHVSGIAYSAGKFDQEGYGWSKVVADDLFKKCMGSI